MTYDPQKHDRHSIRLKGYDYTQPGAYFVTICTQQRRCLFGRIVDGDMRLNDAGRMVQAVWDELAVFYPGVQTDAFMVMPNHVHGIIILAGTVGAGPCACPNQTTQVGADPCACPNQTTQVGADPCACPNQTTQVGAGPCACPGKMGQPQGVAPTLGLPDVVHRFKTMTTKRYSEGVQSGRWAPFPGRLWQRNYYEHIIRNELSLNRIRDYILTNPLRWHLDRENPDRTEEDDTWRALF